MPGLKDLLGVESSVKHVSYNSLITDDGQYRISAQVQEARAAYGAAMEAIDRLPAARRSNRAVLRLKDEAQSGIARLEEQALKIGNR